MFMNCQIFLNIYESAKYFPINLKPVQPACHLTTYQFPQLTFLKARAGYSSTLVALT